MKILRFRDARGVINSPKILFADEPTGALNRKNTNEVLNLLTELNKEGQSILMVTHDIKAALVVVSMVCSKAFVREKRTLAYIRQWDLHHSL